MMVALAKPVDTGSHLSSALALAAAGQANKGSAVAGLVLSGMAVVLGLIRLIVGGGVV